MSHRETQDTKNTERGLKMGDRGSKICKQALARASAILSFPLCCLCLCGFFLCATAQAVNTSHWTHTSESDFAAGQMQAVVATNLGDLKLSRSVKSIFAQDARISAVHALAQAPDGTIYAATGPQGVLLKINDETVSDAAQFGDNVNLFSLLFDRDGSLLVGTGGERGEIFRITKPGEKPQKIFSYDGVQYIWAMLQTVDGIIYAATGPTGQLWSIKSDGKSEVIFDSDENNLLCLATEGGDHLLAGTDPKGLLLRINRKTKQVFVVYDAAETEISALAITNTGDILAATAQAIPDEVEAPAAATEQTGRPEQNIGGMPLQAPPPESPKPPELPEPSPGEPQPIPKLLSIVTDDDPTEAAPSTEPAEITVITPPARAAVALASPAAAGNAVYRIDRDGLVTEIFRSNVAIYSLLANGGEVLAATGSDGRVFQLRPAAEETLALAKVDPKQILSMLRAADGRVYLGCANRGDISVMTGGFANSGTYTSPVLDATQFSRFGRLQLRGTLPQGATLRVSTRSGNISDPAGSGWSDWTAPAAAAEFVPISSPAARFFQYRLDFGSNDGGQTAAVEEVDVTYQLPNLAPRVSAIRIIPGEAANPDLRAKQTVSWDATDPNNDAMKYTLQFRSTGGDWITVRDKLTDPMFELDTRSVADGRYQLRVLASDTTANSPGSGHTSARVSDPFTVDNTPPAIGDIEQKIADNGVSVTLSVVDRTSTVATVEYSVDGGEDWQIVLPSDMIADSPKEAYAFKIPGLSPGPHQLALRATDSAGNRSFATLNVTIEKK